MEGRNFNNWFRNGFVQLTSSRKTLALVVICEHIKSSLVVVLYGFRVFDEAFHQSRDEYEVGFRILLFERSAHDINALTAELRVRDMCIPPLKVGDRTSGNFTGGSHCYQSH